MKANKELIEALKEHKRALTLVRFEILDKLTAILNSEHIYKKDRAIHNLAKYIKENLK